MADVAERPSEGLGLVEADLRRPWPRSIPTPAEGLQAVAGLRPVGRLLGPAHRSALALLPKHLVDQARSGAQGHTTPLSEAVAVAWRGLVAQTLMEDAIAVDGPELLQLIEEVSRARQDLVAAAAFALDHEEGLEGLLISLDLCLNQFLVEARLPEDARKKKRKRRGRTGLIRLFVDEQGTPRSRALAAAAVLCVSAAILFHLHEATEAAAADAWVVVGDPKLGQAFLAPGGPRATEATRQEAIDRLRAAGLELTPTADGRVMLSQRQGATP